MADAPKRTVGVLSGRAQAATRHELWCVAARPSLAFTRRAYDDSQAEAETVCNLACRWLIFHEVMCFARRGQ